MATNNKSSNQQEKRMSFIYVLLFFTVTTALCCFLIFYCDTDGQQPSDKKSVISKIDRIRTYQEVQSNQYTNIDNLLKNIEAFAPGVQAIYEENDIKFSLNNLKNLYEQNSWDKRYKVFMHTATLYSDWLTDKKELWGKKQNIQNFKKNLEDCEIGIKNKEIESQNNSK